MNLKQSVGIGFLNTTQVMVEIQETSVYTQGLRAYPL